jgi:serine/threonine protein kinase
VKTPAPPSEDIDLDETIAAALPDVQFSETLAGGGTPVTLAGNPSPRDSVLPRLELRGERVQLSPAGGPRYATLRALGRGGMGEVALVEDRDIGRQVAVKRLLPEAEDAGVVARFVDEVRTIGRLEHPNIVPIHDVGVDTEGRYFFVMKYVDGETLESVIDRLRRGDPEAVERYDIPRRVEIFEGLLRALAFSHAAGYLHRDIKPANVMVGRYGEVVLMDWGVACPRAGDRHTPESPTPDATLDLSARLSSTQAGSLVGTPHYMSPEQARGETASLDERSDLFSACVLFHELLGLQQRHSGHRSLMAVLMAVNTSEAPGHGSMFAPHPAQPDGVPAALIHFLHRGLQRAPEKRWQSAAEMLDDLHAIAGGECRVQCPVTFSARALTTVQRFLDRRQLFGAIGLNLAVIGVLILAADTVRRWFLGD